MTTQLPSLCVSCLHAQNRDKGTCTAYPNGIPIAIRSGHEGHFSPKPGDGNIIYEPAPGTEEALAQFMLFWYDIEDVE